MGAHWMALSAAAKRSCSLTASGSLVHPHAPQRDARTSSQSASLRQVLS